MKIIHCADLHLDSKLTTSLNKEKAVLRRNEILYNFERLVEYAVNSDVSAIIIAGDMFDTAYVSKTTINLITSVIGNNPDLSFYYLSGNHDETNIVGGLSESLNNLHVFNKEWTSYGIENVTITGIVSDSGNSSTCEDTLELDVDSFNIVVMHGEFNLKKLVNKGIDYLALGHIHSYTKEVLDDRGIYCYSGCLEGRGFDECGKHGFVLLDIDIDNLTFKDTFIPFAKREIHSIDVDISDCQSLDSVYKAIDETLESNNCVNNDIVRIKLKGSTYIDITIDTNYIESRYTDKFFFIKIIDETVIYQDYEAFRHDVSLKGEFIRNVLDPDNTLISEKDKQNIIKLGLKALAGEEVLS